MIANQSRTSWPTRPLSGCGEWISGGTPSKSNSSYWNGEIPWISAKSLKCFELDDSEDRISDVAVRDGATLVPKGTVLFVVRGMSLAKEFRVGVTTRPVAFNQDLRGIIPSEDIDGRYLARFLASSEQRICGLVSDASHGTKRLPTEIIEALSVPVPSLNAQRQVADILDEADALRHKRSEAIQLVNDLVPCIFFDMFGGAGAKTAKWPVVNLEELFAIPPNYGSMIPPTESGMWLDLRVINIQDGKIDLSDRKYVNLPEDMISRHEVRDGDLLLARAIGSREHLGKCFIARPGLERWAFDSHLMRVRFDTDQVLPDYVQAYLTSHAGRAEFMKNTRRSAVQFNINTKEMARIRIPKPSIKIQEEFLDRLQAVQQTARQQRESRCELDNLFHSLLQRAFRGEL